MTLADLLKKQIIMLRTKHLVLAKPVPLTSVDNKMLNVGGLFKKYQKWKKIFYYFWW